MITIALAIGFIIVVGIAQPNFVQFSNLARVLNSTVILALLTAGVAVVIITKNIDVSVGSTMALTGIVAALMLKSGVSMFIVIPLTLLFGGILGAINGLGVTIGRVPSIVMTLGTLGAYRGISFMITGGHSVENIPSEFKKMGTTSLLGLPLFVWLTLGILIVLGLILSKTKTGRTIYATGDNITGAHLIGVPTKTMTVVAFATSGMFASMAALVFLAQIGSISNQAGAGIEMRAIAAAVIGGVALTGGVGTILGASFGALFITTATSSLSFLGVPGFWSDMVIGAILLLALFADSQVGKRMERKRLQARYQRTAPPPTASNNHAATPETITTGGAVS